MHSQRMLAPVKVLPADWSLIPTLPHRKKQTHPASVFWRGGIREPSRFSVSQLTASLHTGGLTQPRTQNPTTQIRCRSWLRIVVQNVSPMVPKPNTRCKGKVRPEFETTVTPGPVILAGRGALAGARATADLDLQHLVRN